MGEFLKFILVEAAKAAAVTAASAVINTCTSSSFSPAVQENPMADFVNNTMQNRPTLPTVTNTNRDTDNIPIKIPNKPFYWYK